MNTPKKDNSQAVITSVDITQYTEDLFFTLFPGSTEEDYMEALDTDELAIVKGIEQQQKQRVEKVRRVVMDSQYLYWLNDVKKKDSLDNRVTYMKNLTDSQVEALWEREFGTHSIESYFLPVTVLSKTDFYIAPSIEIPGAAGNFLSDSLLKHWEKYGVNEEELILMPEMIEMPVYAIEEPRMLMESFEYFFKDGNFPNTTTHKNGPRIPANIGVRYIPIFIKKENKAVLTREKLEYEFIEMEIPEKITADFSLKMIEENEKDKYSYGCYRLMISAFDYEEFFNEFNQKIVEETREIKPE